ncbi:DUF2306 domain-containing protein [Neptunicoccus cionae]|uniref:DUF2306 domain-containing protein n=1 Tax=Neptunicoccus cionae TaxID=2035344 RepID=UPI000C75D514|nr:DUF2306 domain-containing protein [Amylibacter cionae]PLS20954.1 hypothetical protein C0U40_14070 [Amylibacter cionae]
MEFTALAEAGPVIQVHVATAVLAALLGPLALLRRRRDRLHKVSGYIWVLAMAAAALSSFFIRELQVVGRFSPIHILSVVTLIGLAGAIWQIRKRNIAAHKRIMWRLYAMAIGIAGLFSFLPNRVMNNLFQPTEPWVVFSLATAVFLIVGMFISQRFHRDLRN